MQYDPETGLATNTLRQQQLNAFSAQDPWSHLPVRRMVALYDYDPLELSPNPGKAFLESFRSLFDFPFLFQTILVLQN